MLSYILTMAGVGLTWIFFPNFSLSPTQWGPMAVLGLGLYCAGRICALASSYATMQIFNIRSEPGIGQQLTREGGNFLGKILVVTLMAGIAGFLIALKIALWLPLVEVFFFGRAAIAICRFVFDSTDSDATATARMLATYQIVSMFGVVLGVVLLASSAVVMFGFVK